VRLVDVEKWSEISRFSAPPGLWSVCFSPDGSRALTAGGLENEAHVRLWNLESGSELVRYVGHKFGAWHAIFLPDGRSLLSTGQDETIRHWETDTGKQIGMLRHEGQVTAVDVTADGRYALAGAWVSEGKHNLRLFQLDPPKEVHVFHGPSTPLNDIALSPDGRSLLTGGSDGSVRLWKVPDEIQPGGSLQ
jgi:WD40 repeat protein